MRSFCIDISGSTRKPWKPLPIAGAEDIRYMVLTKYSTDDPGIPRVATVVFATSLCLPVPSKLLFNFLREENSRAKVCQLLTYATLLSY